MRKLLKITAHHHSGRLRPHEHTSYFPLMLLLIAVGIVLVRASIYAASPGPEASSIGLSGAVPEPAPVTAAVITTPVNQQRFSESPIAVSGTCPPGTLVEILKNNIFAGSSFCSKDGSFSLEIDPLIGENDLIARVYNALNEPGPNSAPVTIFYDALPPQASSITPLSFADSQLLLNTNAIYRGVFPDQSLSMPVEIIGGTPPFAVDVRWGDSNNTMVPRDNNQPFTINHTYKRPGTYKLTLQATDAQGRVAFLSVVAVVNGQPTITAGSDTDGTSNTGLMAVLSKMYIPWPLYVGAISTVASFWLGEQREKRILEGHEVYRNMHA